MLNEDGLIPGLDDIVGNIDSDERVDNTNSSFFFSLLRQKRKQRRQRTRTRILLAVEETHEIHMYESEEYPGHFVVQRFELVVVQQQ